jgi:hypothetical protein
MAEVEVEYGKNGTIAVTFSAPDFFMQLTAKINYMIPSSIFLFSNDFIINTSCPRTKSNT